MVTFHHLAHRARPTGSLLQGSSAQLGCLDDEELVLFLEGEATPDHELRLKAHIDGCRACRQAVAAGASQFPSETRARRAADGRLDEGSVICGKYRVERVLGSGGMGVVVAARHVELGTRVAIKTMHPELLVDEAAVRRFGREGQAAARLTGDHTARIFDVGNLESGAPFIVMEYLEGKDLGEVLKTRGPLPFVVAVSYILDACAAVSEAHALGIVHRDLKPANIFLARLQTGEQRIKVVDFGLAKNFDGAASGAESGLTRAHAFLGSPHYMSPEQIQSPRDVDGRADIWALGACLYELVAGRPPFLAANVQLVCARILLEPAAPLTLARPGTPKALAETVRRCLERDPARRFQHVDELIEALCVAHAEITGRAGSGAVPEPDAVAELGDAPTLPVAHPVPTVDLPAATVALPAPTVAVPVGTPRHRRKLPAFAVGGTLALLALAATGALSWRVRARTRPPTPTETPPITAPVSVDEAVVSPSPVNSPLGATAAPMPPPTTTASPAAPATSAKPARPKPPPAIPAAASPTTPPISAPPATTAPPAVPDPPKGLTSDRHG